MTRIEKRPGQDWIVTVRVPGEDEPYPVSVFGVEDQALAIVDAFASFGVTAAEPEGHVIVSVERVATDDVA